MIFPSDLRLPPLRGLGGVMAMVWLGAAGMGWAQVSLNPLAPSAFPPPLEELWPTNAEGNLLGRSADRPVGSLTGERLPILPPDAVPGGFSLQFGTERFGTADGATLGRVVDLTVPSRPLPGKETAGTNGSEAEPGPWQLGNVSFNRTAQSFNLSGTEDAGRKDDLSSQLGKVGGPRNVLVATPITGWAIAGVGMLVVVVAMAVAHYESDGDDRKRRKKVRHRRRHHPS